MPAAAQVAEEPPFARPSGLVAGKPKPLNYEAIPGLFSKAQVTPHYNAHYGGACGRSFSVNLTENVFHGFDQSCGQQGTRSTCGPLSRACHSARRRWTWVE